MNRFSQISTSAFDPLSLNEIMAIPLAKQKQQDALLSGTAEVSAIDSQRLQRNDEEVSAKLEDLRGRSRQLSKEILEGGYNRSIRNRFNELKMDQAREFSLQGTIGKAKAIYDKRQANIKAVMADKNLSGTHKQAGLNYALNQFNKGTGEQYIDYVGSEEVDIPALALEVGNKMKPQELAAGSGYTYDERTGLFSDGTYKTKKLPAEAVAKAVNQYLINDPKIGAHMKDMQEIGLISNPTAHIQNAAINAGNILQVNDYSDTKKVLPAAVQKNIRTGKKMIDTQGWYSLNIEEFAEEIKEEYEIDETNDNLFDAEGNLIADESFLSNMFAYAEGLIPGGQPGAIAASVTNKLTNHNNRINRLNEFRRNNPELEGLTDRELATVSNQLRKGATARYSEIQAPINRENSFNYLNEVILGKGEDKWGDIRTRPIHIMGDSTITSFDALAKEMNLDPKELLTRMKNGSLLGISTASKLPMGLALQFSDKDGEQTQTVIVGNSNEISDNFTESSHLTQNQLNGKQFEVEEMIDDYTGKRAYRHYVLDIVNDKDDLGNIISSRYQPKIVYSDKRYNTKEEVNALDPNDPQISIMSQADIINRDSGWIQEYYNAITQKKN